MRRFHRLSICLSCATIGLLYSKALAGAVYDTFYLGATFNYSYGTGVSGDGRVASGYAAVPTYTNGFHAMRWSRDTGPADMGLFSGLQPYDVTETHAVSFDGSTIVGQGMGNSGGAPLSRAFYWTLLNGYTVLGTMPGGTLSSATGVSGNGSVLTGTGDSSFGSTRSFQWTALTGMQDIGNMSGGTRASATGISADGLVIVGNGDSSNGANRAFRWTSAGMEDIGALSGATDAYAYGVNKDGSVIVGASGTNAGNLHPFRWVNGVMQDMGLFPGSTSTTAYGVSPEGDVVVGSYAISSWPYQQAFIWRAGIGYQDLALYANSLGFGLGGSAGPWLIRATGVSSHGWTIAGYSSGLNGRPNGFVLSTAPRRPHGPPIGAQAGGH